MNRGTQEQLQLRLHQWAERAARMELAVPGRFVTGAERALALHAAHESGVHVSFDGGWEDAERVQVCFHPFDESPVFTAQWVRVTWHAKFGHADHASLLGSLMALGMDRAFFGDLIVQDGCAYLMSMPETAQRLPMEWTSAGRTPITAEVMDDMPGITPPKGLERRDTVASLRLDSVLSSGMQISRGKAAECIRAGLVQVDHMPEERCDRLLQPGALLSVRHFGRIRLTEVGSMTRKERLPIVLEIFQRKD